MNIDNKEWVRIHGFDHYAINIHGDVINTVTATSTKYRFASPYGKVGEEQDELGAFLAYPYNEAGNRYCNSRPLHYPRNSPHASVCHIPSIFCRFCPCPHQRPQLPPQTLCAV